jgi:hypothetical protein
MLSNLKGGYGNDCTDRPFERGLACWITRRMQAGEAGQDSTLYRKILSLIVK